jgi:hypothetical protein
MAVSKHKLRANGHRGGSGYTKAKLRSLSFKSPACGFYGLRSNVAPWAHTWVGLYAGRHLFSSFWYGLGQGWGNMRSGLWSMGSSPRPATVVISHGRPYEHIPVAQSPAWLNRVPKARAILERWAGPEPSLMDVGQAWETEESWSRWFLLARVGWRVPTAAPALAFSLHWGVGLPDKAYLGVSGIAYTQLRYLGLMKKGARI